MGWGGGVGTGVTCCIRRLLSTACRLCAGQAEGASQCCFQPVHPAQINIDRQQPSRLARAIPPQALTSRLGAGANNSAQPMLPRAGQQLLQLLPSEPAAASGRYDVATGQRAASGPILPGCRRSPILPGSSCGEGLQAAASRTRLWCGRTHGGGSRLLPSGCLGLLLLACLWHLHRLCCCCRGCCRCACCCCKG